jgi:hypothetical protein
VYSGIHIAFGPGDTFFACDPLNVVGYKSSQNIPQHLRHTLVQFSGKIPAKVALGINEAYFLLWSDGRYTWNLCGQYQQLDQILSGAKAAGKPIKVLSCSFCRFDFISRTSNLRNLG